MAECKMDEYWIARTQYWPEGEIKVEVVFIAYAWENGTIDFIPFNSIEGDCVRSDCCAQFELLERIELEKWV